ncbi:energy transducer TonB [Castellaniella sp. GW247-6E4]|uniref:energy transducer TonB n=1 Tax=Castellaniella sp. GW247-6E4 TaxID=3140380 RepID=UPI0033159506
MPIGSTPRYPLQRLAAALVAIGLHAAVLAMVLSTTADHVAPGVEEALDIQFVELGPAIEPTVEPSAPQPVVEPPPEPEPEPPPEPVVEPEPEPVIEPEPEPVIEPTVEPAPEPVIEPEPAPEPEAIIERPKPEPPPKPKPKPKPVVHKPVPKPAPKPAPEPVAAAPGVSAPAAMARGEHQAVDPDRPRTIGQVDYLGRRPSPIYPRLSERRGEQGRVVLRVLISPQGGVADVTVHRSSGHSRLDQAAIDAMRSARFRPYTENGIAYKALVDIPFDFVL